MEIDGSNDPQNYGFTGGNNSAGAPSSSAPQMVSAATIGTPSQDKAGMVARNRMETTKYALPLNDDPITEDKHCNFILKASG
jgi:hypothetical protein